MKPIKKISNWEIIGLTKSVYTAPELSIAILRGQLECGKKITTSNIIKISLSENIIETLNSIYELGKINVDYEKFLKNLQ